RFLVSTADLGERARVWRRKPALPTATGTRRDVEETVCRLWCEVLGCEKQDSSANFFELGGNSLIGLELADRIGREFGLNLPGYLLFEAPTLNALVARVRALSVFDNRPPQRDAPSAIRHSQSHPEIRNAVAIVGAAGRFPGARDLQEFWKNL